MRKNLVCAIALLAGNAAAAPIMLTKGSFIESNFCKKIAKCTHFETFTSSSPEALNYEVLVSPGGKVYKYGIDSKYGVYNVWISRDKNGIVKESWIIEVTSKARNSESQAIVPYSFIKEMVGLVSGDGFSERALSYIEEWSAYKSNPLALKPINTKNNFSISAAGYRIYINPR